MKKEKLYLTNDELFNKSRELTALSNQLNIINMMLENLDYSRVKNDMFPIHYTLSNGGLQSIVENLSEIKTQIRNISDDICPDA